MDLKEFGVYFSRLREKSGYLSQRQLADVSGVSHSTINRIEAGTHKASPSTLKDVAKYLKDVTYDELMANMGYIELEESNLKHNEDPSPSKTESKTAVSVEPGVYIAYLGGPPEEMDEVEAQHIKKELEEFRRFREERRKRLEQQKDK
ncbi:helix-turn-helix domain-containing protein [Paenibacillus sp. strain BS8-2]